MSKMMKHSWVTRRGSWPLRSVKEMIRVGERPELPPVLPDLMSTLNVLDIPRQVYIFLATLLARMPVPHVAACARFTLLFSKGHKGCVKACRVLLLRCPALHCFSLPCPALSLPALPCPFPPCPARSFPSLPCTAPPCPAPSRPALLCYETMWLQRQASSIITFLESLSAQLLIPVCIWSASTCIAPALLVHCPCIAPALQGWLLYHCLTIISWQPSCNHHSKGKAQEHIH